ncbi:RteC domain-containing protein [Flavobacterium pectinovorum]|uniref:RteC protein n=1 Tax=Flavobacterium pectinovorum TaxID=29533 RepID=A0AB36P833_9FLAO|nr:RteC domain-containing protein [Flavobacterium pectinovorum]OXB07796.1 tetracycline regulation of excision, RteC [Flavobacterium pectinovorum]SHM80794.1 RteC protein [Flavobacterium pectinovorum]
MQSLNTIIAQIRTKEDQVSQQTANLIDEAYQMTLYLEDLLQTTQDYILKKGFRDIAEEIEFFRDIKPQILGQLIYYNKVFRIETLCPVKDGKMYQKFYMRQLQELKIDFEKHICGSHFYRYYKSGRSDRDEEYFLRGNINYRDGLNSYVFELDQRFSTYYDSKLARILANELIYNYLLTKINVEESSGSFLQNSESNKDIFWTDSKNALIELIYALYASGVISHGKIGIRKITLVFQILFRVPLGDIHHSFHRMKDRAGTRTSFLDHLKLSLEQYMDKGL